MDSGDFEESLEVPALEEADNLPTLVQHISVVENAIGKCEKMLQHLAVGNYSEEVDKYMAKHIELISLKDKLNKKLSEMQNQKQGDGGQEAA